MNASPVRFGVVGVAHAHIIGQTKGLLAAGAECVGAYAGDDDLGRERFVAAFPEIPLVDDPRRLLEDSSIELITTAGIPDERAGIAIEAMRNGKDVVADKPGCTTLEQLADIRRTVAETKRFWSVVFSERFEKRSVSKAAQLIADGAIGKVVHTIGLGPHRLSWSSRSPWFFQRERYGGIITDIGSHQIDQFLYFTGSTGAEVVASAVGNFAHPDAPGLEDFGEVMLRSDKAQGYIRVDWYTPDGLGAFGDGRITILGTDGFIELRKYADIAGREGGDHLFLVDHVGEHYVDCSDAVLEYYPNVLRDVRERTETAVPQEHTFTVMELAIIAEEKAERRGNLVP